MPLTTQLLLVALLSGILVFVMRIWEVLLRLEALQQQRIKTLQERPPVRVNGQFQSEVLRNLKERDQGV